MIPAPFLVPGAEAMLHQRRRARVADGYIEAEAEAMRTYIQSA